MLNKFIETAKFLWEKAADLFNFEKVGKLFNFFDKKKKYISFQIKPFKWNEYWISYWIWFLSNFTDLSEELTFFVSGNSSDVKIYVRISENLKEYFENVFYANFPDSDLVCSSDANELYPNEYVVFEDAEVFNDTDFIKNGDYLDPFKDALSIFNSMPSQSGSMNIFYKYNFSFKEGFFQKLFWYMKYFLGKILFNKEKADKNEEETKTKNNLKLVVGYTILSNNKKIKDILKKDIKTNLKKFLKSWSIKLSKSPSSLSLDFSKVANFFHIPTYENLVKNLDYISHRKLPFPSNLPTLDNTSKNDITLLGYTNYKSDNFKFGIKNEDKSRHAYVIWKTWTWKSTLISNMVRSDMVTWKWVAVVDPHWDLITTVLNHVPNRRINDVVLFDISDYEHPIWFNIFQYQNEEEKNLVVSWIVGTFKKLYWYSWWPRLEYILRNVLLSIIEYPNATLMHMIRMLTDKNFKEEVLEYVKDPVVIKFWRQEFDKWQDNFRNEAISPIVNKVWQFLSSPLVRNIFWQPKTQLNFRKMMDEWKILLVNLSKWKVWEDNSIMIGSFFVTKFQIDAMARADIEFDQRRDFFLYIDEFQNFATESFENILSEARKYRLSLIVANQYISQVSENIRNAIFGNVWTIISFWLWYDDAVLMSNQFKEIVSKNDLLSLPRFQAYIKLMVDWILTDPFSMSTFPLPDALQWEETKNKIKYQSRQRYWMERDKLEKLLKNWSEKTFSPTEKAVEKAKKEAKDYKKSSFWEWNKEQVKEQDFSVEDIKKWEWYKGFVKLKYNFWLFVTVKWVDGLLHKKNIVVPEDIKWKDYYNIWDRIEVKAEDFKEVKGEKKIVWTQK